MEKMEKLTFEILKKAVTGTAAAFRCVTEYQPAGGVGDKVFPPTYEGGKYAVEDRIVDGQPVPCDFPGQQCPGLIEASCARVWARGLFRNSPGRKAG